MEILAGDDVGRGHGPVDGHLDILLLEDRPACGVSDEGSSALPLNFVVGRNRGLREEALEAQGRLGLRDGLGCVRGGGLSGARGGGDNGFPGGLGHGAPSQGCYELGCPHNGGFMSWFGGKNQNRCRLKISTRVSLRESSSSQRATCG